MVSQKRKSLLSVWPLGFAHLFNSPKSFLLGRLGHNDCVLEILNASNKDLNLNQEDRSGFSPLVSAVYGGHTDVVVSLIKGFVKEKPNHVPD